MKQGDLVNFSTKSWVMGRAEYELRNPGVIINSRINKHEILWANGTITVEHFSYLEVISESR